MSCYEWERGKWIIPARQFNKLRLKVIEAHNESLQKEYQNAIRMYEELKKMANGQKNFDYRQAYDSLSLRIGLESGWKIWYILFKNRNSKRPIKPKKGDFKPLPKNAHHIQCDEVSIEFDKENRTVLYDVPKNNHACDRARALPAVKALFTALRKGIKWTRGTGGTVWGDDEYAEDVRRENPDLGDDLTKEYFGPIGDEKLKEKQRIYQMYWRQSKRAAKKTARKKKVF